MKLLPVYCFVFTVFAGVLGPPWTASGPSMPPEPVCLSFSDRCSNLPPGRSGAEVQGCDGLQR